MIQPATTAAIGLGQAEKIDLARVASSTKLSETEKMLVAAEHFEAMLARQILSDAYKPMFDGGMEMKGVSSDVYRDMIVKQLGDAVGKSGAFGIATALHGQLTTGQPTETVAKDK